MMTLTGFGGTISAPKPLLFRYYLDGPIRAGNQHVLEDFSLVRSRELVLCQMSIDVLSFLRKQESRLLEMDSASSAE